MKTAIADHTPKGDMLEANPVGSEEQEQARLEIAQIQRGLDASGNPFAPRTAHADFMSELKTELLHRRDVS